MVVFWKTLFTKAVLFYVIILYKSDTEQVPKLSLVSAFHASNHPSATPLTAWLPASLCFSALSSSQTSSDQKVPALPGK